MSRFAEPIALPWWAAYPVWHPVWHPLVGSVTNGAGAGRSYAVEATCERWRPCPNCAVALGHNASARYSFWMVSAVK